MAVIDTSAMETRPPARRFEIYGSRGSAIMEPLEPATHIRLCLAEAQAGYGAGEEMVAIQTQTRQELYDLALVDFLATIQGAQPATRRCRMNSWCRRPCCGRPGRLQSSLAGWRPHLRPVGAGKGLARLRVGAQEDQVGVPLGIGPVGGPPRHHV